MGEAFRISEAFRQLMKLTGMGATGRNVPIGNVDWPSVLKLAQEQAVLPLVGAALINCPGIACPEQLRASLLMLARKAAEKDFVRKNRILRMTREMEGVGIDVQLIKGYAVADCYSFPECRSSTDSDILVPLDQEHTACDFLRNKGFQVEMRSETDHHDVCQHPQLGVVEIHVHLYNELRREIWFEDINCDGFIKEPSIQMMSSGIPFRTLGCTDHLIFLSLHLIEHFICAGMGLRMMTDIALFFSKYRDQIDTKRYWKVMDQLKYATLMNCVLWAMIDTGCFDASEFTGISEECPDSIDLILFDLERGGHLGVNTGYQFDGAYEYSRQLYLHKKSVFRYYQYIIRYKLRDAKKRIFPENIKLIESYHCLGERKWLIPFAKVYHMFWYIITKVSEGSLKKPLRTTSAQMPEEAKRRVEMLKKLGMI